MLRIRIASICALAAIAIASAGSAASAQDAATQPGKPLALLAGLNPPHESKNKASKNKQAKSHASKPHAAKAAVHSKTAHARTHHAKHTNLADKTTTRQGGTLADEQTVPSPKTVTDNKWPVPQDPAAQAPAAQDNAATNTDAAPSVAAAAPTAGDSDMSAVVVNGQTVQISSPDAVNDIDRAAATPNASPAQNAIVQTPDQQSADTNLQPATARAAVAAMSNDSEAVSSGSGSDNAPANPHAGASPVGSASWIAQVLAALGGAVAAGAVAWFLIGSGPARTYG